MTTYYLTDANKNWAIKNLTFPSDASLNIYGNTYTNSTTISNTQLGVGISDTIDGSSNTLFGYLVNPLLTTGSDNVSIGNNIGISTAYTSRNTSIGSNALKNITRLTGLTALGLASNGSYLNNLSGTFSLAFQVIGGPSPTSYPTGYAYAIPATSNGIPVNFSFVTEIYLTYSGSGFTSSTSFLITVPGLGPSENPANIVAFYNDTNNGNDNIALGYNALTTTASGIRNTAIGNYALANLSQTLDDLIDNIAIGHMSQYRVISGIKTIAIGDYSLSGSGTTNNSYKPTDVICLGHYAMSGINSGAAGSNSIAIGSYAMSGSLSTNSGATNNIVIGHNSLKGIINGTYNIIMGNNTGNAITSGLNNVLLGHSKASNLTVGGYNTVVGNGSLSLTTGSHNTFLGYSCGGSINTGSSNTCIGNYCGLGSNVNSCVFIGDNAGWDANGNYGICIGYYAGQYLGSGVANPHSNICIGRTAGTYFMGSQSVFIGYQAGFVNSAAGTVAATNNVGIGTNALGNLTSGANNTVVGTWSSVGSGTTTGSNISTLGYNALPSSATASNQVTLGNTSVTSLRCAVTAITSTSDARDKKDIEDLSVGLDFINKLRPVKFTWNMRPDIETDASGNTTEVHSTKNGDVEAGFIAQELDSVQEETNTQWLDIVYKDNPDRLETTQGKLIPLLVKAIQELSAKVDSLTAEIAILKAK